MIQKAKIALASQKIAERNENAIAAFHFAHVPGAVMPPHAQIDPHRSGLINC